MYDKLYTVRLADGTELTNLVLNGNNFISKIPLFSSLFEYNLDRVVISDGETAEEYHNMALIHLTKMSDDSYWFALRELSQQEIKDAKLRADVDYLYMMTGVD